MITAGFSLLIGGLVAYLALTAAIDAGLSAYSVAALTYVAWVASALVMAAALTFGWRQYERRRAARQASAPEAANPSLAGTEAPGSGSS